MTDFELIREYVEQQSESAFSELVKRHMGLVYSSAMRQLRDVHLAQDVAQGVFINLARAADRIRPQTVLAGWLLTATRFLSLDARKVASRRLRHEREAALINKVGEPDETGDWDEIAPVFDDAMAKLGERSRDALTLRFFENKSVKEVAHSLRISEDAAKQRLSRAVQQLRSLLMTKGVRIGVGALAALVAANAVQAYPIELVGKTVATATATPPAATFSISGVFKMIALHKIKAAILALALLASVIVATTAKSGDQADDGRVQAILKKAREALDKANTFQASLEVVDSDGMTSNRRSGTVALQKPNLGRITYIKPGGGTLRTEISDGSQLFIIRNPEKEYHRPLLHGHTPEHLLTSVIPVLAGFWNSFPLIVGPDEIKYAGTEAIDGQTYDVIRYGYKGSTSTGKVYFAASGLLTGWIQSSGGKDPIISRYWLKDIKLGVPIEPAGFAFDPLAVGFKEFERSKENDTFLVPVGEPAPEFELSQAGGGKLTLAAARKGKKAVLVNFWFCDCSACRHELPQMQYLYDHFKEKGLEILAIDNGDIQEDVLKVAKEGKLTFPLLMGGALDDFAIAGQYGVEAFPTNFLIDPDGKVIWRGAGFDERELMGALEKAGIK